MSKIETLACDGCSASAVLAKGESLPKGWASLYVNGELHGFTSRHACSLRCTKLIVDGMTAGEAGAEIRRFLDGGVVR